MVLLEENRRLYVAAPPSRSGFKLCHALAVPSSPVFVEKSNAIADADGAGTMGRKRYVYMQIAIADHVVMVIMKLLERVGLWAKQCL